MVTYAGTNTDQRSQRALVEGHGAFFLEDLGGAVHGTRVLSGGLQAHLDDICRLVRRLIVNSYWISRTKWLSCIDIVSN